MKFLLKIAAAGAVMLGLLAQAHAQSGRIYIPETGTWANVRTGASAHHGGKRIQPKVVSYKTNHKPGTIIVDHSERRLYLVMEGGKARKYGVGVGRPGFEWTGTNRISRKAKWPGWTPPASMRKRQPYLPAYMPGGPKNPLGARALYLGSTIYRIHGTNSPGSIGQAMSSGCIRMMNDDVKDLYNRVPVGAKVVVQM